jgi:hypothetical protein
MIEQLKERVTQLDKRLQLGIGIGVGLIILLLLLFWLLRDERRQLKPLRTESNADLVLVSDSAQFVAFPDLNAAPEAYLNQVIRVSGNYAPQQPPTCLPYSGPTIQWALISEGLQLDAKGFEAILHRVPEGTILTVDGVWRRYHGPFGCGKEPPDNDAWYLEVTQIIEPNPLFGGENAGLNTILGPGRTPTPQIVSAGEETGPTATADPAITPTATLATIGQSTSTPTTTPIVTPTTTGTATPTSVPGTPTLTRTPTITPTPTTTGTVTTTPTITPTPQPGVIPPTLPPPDPYTGPPTPPGYP